MNHSLVDSYVALARERWEHDRAMIMRQKKQALLTFCPSLPSRTLDAYDQELVDYLKAAEEQRIPLLRKQLAFDPRFGDTAPPQSSAPVLNTSTTPVTSPYLSIAHFLTLAILEHSTDAPPKVAITGLPEFGITDVLLKCPFLDIPPHCIHVFEPDNELYTQMLTSSRHAKPIVFNIDLLSHLRSSHPFNFDVLWLNFDVSYPVFESKNGPAIIRDYIKHCDRDAVIIACTFALHDDNPDPTRHHNDLHRDLWAGTTWCTASRIFMLDPIVTPKTWSYICRCRKTNPSRRKRPREQEKGKEKAAHPAKKACTSREECLPRDADIQICTDSNCFRLPIKHVRIRCANDGPYICFARTTEMASAVQQKWPRKNISGTVTKEFSRIAYKQRNKHPGAYYHLTADAQAQWKTTKTLLVGERGILGNTVTFYPIALTNAFFDTWKSKHDTEMKRAALRINPPTPSDVYLGSDTEEYASTPSEDEGSSSD